MNNPNRYEEVPQKENVFLKGLKTFGNYIKFVFVDFFNSFKYNNMKLASILFALPGLFLGFFMFAHVPTIKHIISEYSMVVEGSNVQITAELNDASPADGDYSLTLAEYAGKTNVVLVKEVIDSTSKDENGNLLNQDLYAFDGYAKTDAQTKQIDKPEAKLENDADDSNVYKLTVTNFADISENVASYSLFIYEVVNGYSYVNYNLSRVGLALNDEGSVNVTYNNLNSNNEYKLAVKAIAKDGTEFYSSALSELTAFSVTKDGTEFIDEDYGSYVTSFINIAGTYYVSKVNGSDFVPDDAIETLKMVVNANGTAEYVLNGKTTSTRLFNNGDTYTSRDTKKVTVLPFDFSGPVLFVMTLVGFLSVFVALDLSKKKNLGSVIKAALCTFAVLLSGALYIYSIMATEDALHNGFEIESYSTMFDTNCLISIVVVCIAMASSLAGLILSFINYDRTYEKVDR
jgi:branched-subunit amino acid transport protein